jgi:hypothetical protein
VEKKDYAKVEAKVQAQAEGKVARVPGWHASLEKTS